MQSVISEPKPFEVVYKKENDAVSGVLNKKLWALRNRVDSVIVKDFIDYYVVGGMTSDEQMKYLPSLGRDPLQLSRGNALLDFTLTSLISMFPLVSEVIVKNSTSYDGDVGLYTALGAIGQSAVVNTGRIMYTYMKKKPVESFSLFSLVANSTTYLKRMSTIQGILEANHSEFFSYELDNERSSDKNQPNNSLNTYSNSLNTYSSSSFLPKPVEMLIDSNE